MKGYMGKVLIVDLSAGITEYQSVPDEVYENVLSGVGLGDYMIYKMIPAGADPLGPDNVLGFTSGLGTGTGAFMTGRWMAVCKSPLTGGIGEANCGGNFSPALKQCGVDAIFFKGASEKPVYLYVDNKGAVIRDASHVWGTDAVTAEEILIAESTVRKKPQAVMIGEAGENMSLISGIINDGGRIAARSGVGAVMGSKKLKGVLCAGSKPIRVHDQAQVHRLSAGYADIINGLNLPGFLPPAAFGLMGSMSRRTMLRNKDTVDITDGAAMMAGAMKRFGTSVGYAMSFGINDAPIKNWAGTYRDMKLKDVEKLGTAAIHKIETQKYHCYSCNVGCGGICDIKKQTGGRYSHTHKPEYETQALLGSMFLNSDFDAFLEMNELLNRAGMDTIAAGGTIAFAVECFENGLLTMDDTDGLELTWGNGKAALELLKKMIHRTPGIGAMMADGPKKAAERLGKGSEKYAITAGGQPLAAHDPRNMPLMGIQYSADPTPGKHTSSGGHYEALFLWEKADSCPVPSKHLKTDELKASEEHSRMTMCASAGKQLVDGIGGCVFAFEMGVNNWPLFEFLNAITGWDLSGNEYMTIGKRMETIRQQFNIKHGINPKDFFMHKRLLKPLPDGALKGRGLEEHDQMIAYHWKAFGWDMETGAPLPETLKELGLDTLLAGEVTING